MRPIHTTACVTLFGDCTRPQHQKKLLLCYVLKFTIGESRTISHANDTQAQQVTPNPRPEKLKFQKSTTCIFWP